MKKPFRFLFLAGLLSLTSCALFPQTSSHSTSSSQEQSSLPQESSSAQPSSEQPSSEQTVSSDLSSEQPSSEEPPIPTSSNSSEELVSSESSIPPVTEPTLSLPIGTYKGKIEIAKHQYSTVDYLVTLPYEGNNYEFPMPSLLNYDGEYDIAYSDKDTITFAEKEDALYIKAKYNFGGYFHMVATDKDGQEIDSIYIQLQTSQIGEGELHFYDANTNEEIKNGSTLTLVAEHSIDLKVTYNATNRTDIVTVSDPSILSLNVTSLKIKVTASQKLGDALLEANLSLADSAGTDHDYYAFLVISVVKDQTLDSIYLEGEEVYIYNNEPKYNGTFYALLRSGDKVEIPESDLEMKRIGSDQVSFSYTLGEIKKSVTYQAKTVIAEKYSSKNLKHSFKDYWQHYSTGMTPLPTKGDMNLLVIPIWFTNSTTYFDISKKEEIRQDLNTVVFGDGSDLFASVASFYHAESRKLLTITGKVADWYVDENASTLYNDRITDTMQGLFNRAVADYIEKNPNDHIDNYDSNGDNKFDVVLFYYAANYYGQLNNTNSDGCAFRFNNSGVAANQYMNNATICPIGAVYGYRGEVNSEQKTMGDLSALRPESFKDGASIAIHEMGHLFGAVDLYSEEGNTHMTQGQIAKQYAGKFSMQDNNKGGHDPLQTTLYNWGSPIVFSAKDYEVGTKLSVYLDDFQFNHNTILLTPEWNSEDSPFDEYMMLELYSPSGLNEFHSKQNNSGVDASGHGIRLWHADAGLMKDNNNKRGYYPTQSGISFIASNHNVWDMNNFHFAHMIRNNEAADYEPTKGMVPDDLFQTNDSFSMETYSKQFLNGKDLLDSGKKLGWEFKVTSLFHNGNGGYSGSVELTRVDDTLTEFETEIKWPSNLNSFPQGTSVDATEFFQLDKNILMLSVNQNGSAVAPSVAYQNPDYYLLLGKESYVEISMASKTEGGLSAPIGTIKRIQLIYMLSTTVTSRGKPSVYVGSSLITGTKDDLDVPAPEPYYMSESYTYDINSSVVQIKNKSDNNLYLNYIRIEYSIPTK